MGMSLASPQSSACMPSSPRDSEYGLANWQLGLEALLDVRKSDPASPPLSARHSDVNVDTLLQDQVDYWKERAVQTMHDAHAVKMKPARCALLFVWGIFRTWQKHARMDRDAPAEPQTQQ